MRMGGRRVKVVGFLVLINFQAPIGGELQSRRATGKALERGAIMGGGNSAAGMGIPVAVLAEDEVVGGAADGNRLGGAVVTDLRA